MLWNIIVYYCFIELSSPVLTLLVSPYSILHKLEWSK